MRTPLTDPDGIARGFLLESLDISAHDHDLSTRIVDFVRRAAGTLLVVFEDWFDPSSAERFDAFPHLPTGAVRRRDDNPHFEMGTFVVDFHRRVSDALTVVEDWAADAATPMNRFPELSVRDRVAYSLPAEDRILVHGRRDYYTCLSGRDVMLDDAEFLVRAKHHWQTGICAVCPNVPPWGSRVDDAFVDDLVANLRHVFVPAFDTSGYLVWTPEP